MAEVKLHRGKFFKFYFCSAERHQLSYDNAPAPLPFGIWPFRCSHHCHWRAEPVRSPTSLKAEHVGPIVLFFSLSDALLIAAGVSGVGAFLSAAPHLTTYLAVGGAAFLGWYALAALRRMASPNAMSAAGGAGIALGQALATGAAFTFLNPHVYLDTVLLMGTAGSAQPEDLRPIFALGAAAASFTWFAILGYGARLLQPVFARPSAWRVLDLIVGIVMLSLAASLLIGTFHHSSTV